MSFHHRHSIGHSFWFATKTIILFSAITHLIILAYVSLGSGSTQHIHYLDILDLDLLWGPGVLIGHWAFWMIPILITLLVLYRYDQTH